MLFYDTSCILSPRLQLIHFYIPGLGLFVKGRIPIHHIYHLFEGIGTSYFIKRAVTP